MERKEKNERKNKEEQERKVGASEMEINQITLYADIVYGR